MRSPSHHNRRLQSLSVPLASSYSPLFSFPLSQGWFPKRDIITQRLSEGLMTLGAPQMQLKFDFCERKKKKKNIPQKMLCRGVESWTVTGVYFCDTHQQGANQLKTTPPIQSRIRQ